MRTAADMTLMSESLSIFIVPLLLLLLLHPLQPVSTQSIYVTQNPPFCQCTRNDTFASSFIFGSATAAAQVEGAWNIDGRGRSVWDQGVIDKPWLVADRSTPRRASESYTKYNLDVVALKETGIKAYRFSISWSRILPNGLLSSRNQRGIDYYHRLIDLLRANGIEPVVTMHHYDTPQELQKMGGLANRIFVEYFEDYADLLFREYGNKVKKWITFNEPLEVCTAGYGLGSVPPYVEGSGMGYDYLCAHHVLLSHARAYRLYGSTYRATQRGVIGIALSTRWYYSFDGKDYNTPVRALAYRLGWFVHPIFSTSGGYPPLMVSEVARNSRNESLARSRLPVFSSAEITALRGSADFLGYNYYTSTLVSPDPRGPSFKGWFKDFGISLTFDPAWKQAKSSWLFSVPWGLRHILWWTKNTYNNPIIWITENGWSDSGQLMDTGRIEYYRLHLAEILKNIKCDGVRVQAYFFWTIIDNWEWLAGFTERFGLYYINFNTTNLARVAKASSRFLYQVITTRRIPGICTA